MSTTGTTNNEHLQNTMDYVSEDSAEQNVADVEQLLQRVEMLEEDNTILRNMLQRQNNNVQHLQGLPQERLASSHDKLQTELSKEKNRRQTAENLLETSRREFEKVITQQSQEVRKVHDMNTSLRTEVDLLKARLRDAESMIVALRKDNDHLRIENDSLRFQQRKTDKKDPHAPFVHRNGPVPFSQVLRALNGSNGGKNTSRSTNGRSTSRSLSAQQQNGGSEEYRFVDANATTKNDQVNSAVHTARSRLRSTSPYQQQNGKDQSSGSRSRSVLLEIREGARVTWQVHQGIIRYIGPVDDLAAGEWVGIELVDGTMGDHGGCYAGRQYFVCSRRTGVFCRASELSAPRLLDQFPAEPRQGGGGISSSRSASMLTTGALRSASYNTNYTEDGSATNNGGMSHRSRSANQQGYRSASARSRNSARSARSQSPSNFAPASPRRVERDEYKAAQARVDAALAQVAAAQGNVPAFTDEVTMPELKSLLNLVNPAENVQKIVAIIALSLHMVMNRDPTTNKDAWDRTRAPRMNERAKKYRDIPINGETAELISVYDATFDLNRVKHSGGNTAVTLCKYVLGLVEVAEAVSELNCAQASLSNICCDEAEEEEEQQQEQQEQEQQENVEQQEPTAEGEENTTNNTAATELDETAAAAPVEEEQQNETQEESPEQQQEEKQQAEEAPVEQQEAAVTEGEQQQQQEESAPVASEEQTQVEQQQQEASATTEGEEVQKPAEDTSAAAPAVESEQQEEQPAAAATSEETPSAEQQQEEAAPAAPANTEEQPVAVVEEQQQQKQNEQQEEESSPVVAPATTEQHQPEAVTATA